MPKKSTTLKNSIYLLLFSLLFPALTPVFASSGHYEYQITDQTKYVDKYFEVDKNGNFKVNIYLGDQKLGTADDSGIYYNITDHLGSPTIITNQTGEVIETNDYESYGRVKDTNSQIDNQYKYTGKLLDPETNLQYYGARYYDNLLNRFTSIDPATLKLFNKESFQQRYNRSLENYLANPQNLNSYAYAVGNPLVMKDNDGEFAGPFGRDMASGQRDISSFFYNAANYTSNQGGFINKVSGFVASSIGDVFNNMANIYDPDQGAGARVLALGFTALDASSGGEGKGVANLGKITKEAKILDVATRPIKSLNDIKGYTAHGLEEAKKYGLTKEFIKDAVENTSKFTKRVDALGRESFRYASDKAVVNFNKFKKIITGWPK